MNSKMKKFRTIFLLASVLLVGLIVLNGCKKKAPPETGPGASVTTEQTTCPVMGDAIDKAVFTEYKGKKVYFCCAICKPKFEKDPEKYIAKLPQFKD